VEVIMSGAGEWRWK